MLVPILLFMSFLCIYYLLSDRASGWVMTPSECPPSFSQRTASVCAANWEPKKVWSPPRLWCCRAASSSRGTAPTRTFSSGRLVGWLFEITRLWSWPRKILSTQMEEGGSFFFFPLSYFRSLSSIGPLGWLRLTAMELLKWTPENPSCLFQNCLTATPHGWESESLCFPGAGVFGVTVMWACLCRQDLFQRPLPEEVCCGRGAIHLWCKSTFLTLP